MYFQNPEIEMSAWQVPFVMSQKAVCAFSFLLEKHIALAIKSLVATVVALSKQWQQAV